jgi:hypothetical protein
MALFDNHTFKLLSSQVNDWPYLEKNFVGFVKIHHTHTLDLWTKIDVRLPVFHLFR